MNLGKWISMIFEMNPGKRISMIFEMTLANEYPWSDLYFDIQISMSFLLFETKYLDIFDIKTYFTFRNCLMWYMTALWPCICMKQKPITRQVCILIILLFFMASTANIQPLAERLRDFSCWNEIFFDTFWKFNCILNTRLKLKEYKFWNSIWNFCIIIQ